MAFSDPQSVTIGTAQSLPRTGSSDNAGTFRKDDQSVTLTVTHAYGKRGRSVARVDHKKIAADPLQPATNVPYSASVYLVLDKPITGYSPTELLQLVTGLTTWLTASSNAAAAKFIGGES
jgi:hypothetical protein